MPSPVAEEAEKEASLLFTQGSLRTGLQKEELRACLYPISLGSWEKLVKKGSVPPLLPADRTRAPVTQSLPFLPLRRRCPMGGMGGERLHSKKMISGSPLWPVW